MNTFGKKDMQLEEVISNLEECRDALNANIELIKRGVRPINEDWQKCAIPLAKCMNYLINTHEELEDSRYNYKDDLLKAYNKFKAENDCKEPNAVWLRIEMTDPKGYDTPFFCGYVFFITEDEIDECYENGCIFKDKNGYKVSELDAIYYSNSLAKFIEDVENGYTDFKVVGVDEFALLEKNLIDIKYGKD